jgi:hypothetical protein
MPDEKSKYEHLPIPTYEEATSSRSNTPSTRNTNERSDHAERQGLLGTDDFRQIVPTRRAGYRPPPTDNGSDSSRTSLENGLLSPDSFDRDSMDSGADEVHREMEEMEVVDPSTERSRWGKRFSSLGQSLSMRLPRWGSSRLRIPNIKWGGDTYIMLGRFFAVFLVAVVVYIIFISDIFTSASQMMNGQMYDPESVRVFAQSHISEHKIREYLEYVTKFDHLAGTEGDYVLATWMEGLFAQAGFEDVKMDTFDVYLNYPKEGGRKVGILNDDGSLKWQAKLEEDAAYPDRQQTPVFHGHSKAGNVTGPLIYANYGSREDFKRLYDSGIETQGAIALVRYYGNQGDRALKVKAAEQVGFVGCIIYSDPADDGFLKGKPYPEGRYMPDTGVQRGGVSLMSWVVGDVLTPGKPSVKGTKRISKENNPGLNNIPSIPISWRDAQPLLQSLKGYGNALPEEWIGGVPDVEWWSGNKSTPTVWLQNLQDEVDEQPIWNVMGKITGVEQKEKAIIVGNHRDAWVFGAADPGSGTAVMAEVVRIFGELVSLGWRPLRTIQFASWDGEEYNLIGSTEYVEGNMDELRKNAFAYLNVDVAVRGSEFQAAASPVFKKALLRVLNRTSDPVRNQTMRQIWDEKKQKLQGLGAGSDYVAFQDMAGTSSIDFGFGGEPYPYHSCYDNFEWMDKFGDPGFQYHKLLGQIWVLLILELADRPVLPFDMVAYSAAVTRYVLDLESWLEHKGANQAGHPAFNTEKLREAVLQFNKDARLFEKWENEWDKVVGAAGGFESQVLGAHRMSHNTRMANFETHLLDLEKGGGVSIPMILIHSILCCEW